VLDYIKRHAKTERGDAGGVWRRQDDPARADLLSKLRAMAVRRELVKTAWCCASSRVWRADAGGGE
jgi:phosphate transport system substrate-binding protein